MKLIESIITWLLASAILALCLWWYGCLWMPRLQISYWTQALPVALITVGVLNLDPKTLPAKCLGGILGMLFLLSAITQALVWVSIVPHPNF